MSQFKSVWCVYVYVSSEVNDVPCLQSGLVVSGAIWVTWVKSLLNYACAQFWNTNKTEKKKRSRILDSWPTGPSKKGRNLLIIPQQSEWKYFYHIGLGVLAQRECLKFLYDTMFIFLCSNSKFYSFLCVHSWNISWTFRRKWVWHLYPPCVILCLNGILITQVQSGDLKKRELQVEDAMLAPKTQAFR